MASVSLSTQYLLIVASCPPCLGFTTKYELVARQIYNLGQLVSTDFQLVAFSVRITQIYCRGLEIRLHSFKMDRQ